MNGRTFKKIREEVLHMTQEELGGHLELSRNTVYMMESNQASIDGRTRLALAALALGLRDYPKI